MRCVPLPSFSLAALVANQQCRPGENLIFNVEVLNCYKHLKVYASLVQYAMLVKTDTSVINTIRHEIYRYFCETPRDNQKLLSYRIKLGTLGTKECSKEWLSKTFWIPSKNLAPVQVQKMYPQARVLSLGHHFVLTVQPRFGNKIEVRVCCVEVKTLYTQRCTFPSLCATHSCPVVCASPTALFCRALLRCDLSSDFCGRRNEVIIRKSFSL